jgi:hypothetical protein
METNSEWELVGVEEARNVRTYPCCAEPYVDITYNLTLRRRSPTYSAIVVTPATGMWGDPLSSKQNHRAFNLYQCMRGFVNIPF